MYRNFLEKQGLPTLRKDDTKYSGSYYLFSMYYHNVYSKISQNLFLIKHLKKIYFLTPVLIEHTDRLRDISSGLALMLFLSCRVSWLKWKPKEDIYKLDILLISPYKSDDLLDPTAEHS